MSAGLLLGSLATVATVAWDGFLGGITDGTRSGTASTLEAWITKQFNPKEEESDIQAQIKANKGMQEKMLAFRKVELELQERQRLDNLAFEAQDRQKNRDLQAYEGFLNRLTTTQEGQLNRQASAVEHNKDRNHQAYLANLNHELQRELTEWNQQFQAHEGQLSRQLQRELSALTHEFQANEGKLNREHAERLEHFRAAVQQWALEEQRELELKKMAFQKKERGKDRQLQSDLASLNRELERELAQWNREFQADQGILNRQLQRELSALTHDFQANEGQLNRQHAARLERFRAQMQRWVLEQERELQLELKRLEGDLARELCEIERKNALAQLREKKRLGHLPIGLLSEEILTTVLRHPLPLRVFFSPPNPHFEQSANPAHVVKKFPHLEDALAESSITRGLRPFLHKYSDNGRPIESFFGAWIAQSDRALKNEGAARAVFTELKSNPILILESKVVGRHFDLHFAFWGSNWSKPRYKSATAFSWQEMLYDFAKLRTLEWHEQAKDKSEEKFVSVYGEEKVKKHRKNFKIIGRERQAIAMDINPKAIQRDYHLDQEDYDKLTQFIITCHCLIAGLLADEYFLLHVPPDVRQYPLLPALLPNLLNDVPAELRQQLITITGNFYQALSNALSQEESTWMPELRLEIAHSLAHLPDKSCAKQQIADSIRSWMELRGMEPVENPDQTDIPLDALIAQMAGGLLTMSDHQYLAKLDDCLSAVYA